MQYRVNPRNGDRISALGYGCMRFPRNGSKIDQEKTEKLVRSAIELGINYFDTAYIYAGVEEALGKSLESAGLRDRVFIATKLPIYFCKASGDFDRLFNKQLERLRTDRVDYYLIHMLSDMSSWKRLEALGLAEWIAAQKKSGRIVNIGFSYHGGKNEFPRLIDCYDWDFTMIQYNYLDENSQAGREGLLYASGKGLPVFVMEPLRGGLLANELPDNAAKVFRKTDSERTLVEWGMRWVWDQPQVTMALSGMSTMEQLSQSADIAERSTADSLTSDEREVYARAVSEILARIKVACTGCAYCMPCPHGVDIPTCFSCYNELYSHSWYQGIKRYVMNTGFLSVEQSYASKCKKCGKCEKHCPQGIRISKELGRVSRKMEIIGLRTVTAAARRILKIVK